MVAREGRVTAGVVGQGKAVIYGVNWKAPLKLSLSVDM